MIFSARSVFGEVRLGGQLYDVGMLSPDGSYTPVDFSRSYGGLFADRVGMVSVFGARYAEVDHGTVPGQLLLQGCPHRTPEGFELDRSRPPVHTHGSSRACPHRIRPSPLEPEYGSRC